MTPGLTGRLGSGALRAGPNVHGSGWGRGERQIHICEVYMPVEDVTTHKAWGLVKIALAFRPTLTRLLGHDQLERRKAI